QKVFIGWGVGRVAPGEMEDDLRFFLATRHWLDVLDQPLVTRLDRLADVCKEVLAADGAQRGPAPPPGPKKAAARPRSDKRRSRRGGVIAAPAAAPLAP